MSKRDSLIAGLVVALPILICGALFAGGQIHLFGTGDESEFHSPTVSAMVETWPKINWEHYRSSTLPGLHWMLALLLYATGSMVPCRVLIAFCTWLAGYILYCTLRRDCSFSTSLCAATLLILSPYVLGNSITITTDNPGLLLAMLAAGPFVAHGVTPLAPRLWSVLAVAVRQTYIAIPLLHLIERPRSWRLWAASLLALTPVVVFFAIWRGPVPPAFRTYNAGPAVGLSAATMSLCILGFFAILLCPKWLWESARGLGQAKSATLGALTLALGLLGPLSRPETGEVNVAGAKIDGYLMEVASKTPQVVGMGFLLWVLLATGILAFASWTSVAGTGRRCAIIVTALTVPYCASGIIVQRYMEGAILCVTLFFVTKEKGQNLPMTIGYWILMALSFAFVGYRAIASL